MGFTTKLAARYWLKTLVMATVCIVLGLWGVWDYVVAIPRDTMRAARADTLRIVQNGLDAAHGSESRAAAIVALDAAITLDNHKDVSWSNSLETMMIALSVGDPESYRAGVQLVGDGLNEYGDAIAPSKYDRPMQWMFILCLPFGGYYILTFLKMSKRAKTYLLTDDGVLTTPEGTWAPDKIASIDMSRWIAKSGNARSTWTAKVVLDDGSTVVLDDFIYKDMHQIIGKLAHGFYPDEWTVLARRVNVQSTDSHEEKE